MSGKAAKIRLTEKQQAVLEQIASSVTAPQRLIQRARVILLGFARRLNVQIAQEIELDRSRKAPFDVPVHRLPEPVLE